MPTAISFSKFDIKMKRGVKVETAQCLRFRFDRFRLNKHHFEVSFNNGLNIDF